MTAKDLRPGAGRAVPPAARTALVVIGLLVTAPLTGNAQSVIVPHRSILFRPAGGAATPSHLVSDPITTDERVVSAIVWGLITGGVTALIIGEGDASSGDRSTQQKIVIGMAVVGAAAGFVTGGRLPKD